MDDNKDSGAVVTNDDNVFDNVEFVSSDHSRTVELRSVEDVMEDSYLRSSIGLCLMFGMGSSQCIGVFCTRWTKTAGVLAVSS
jgi:hypothetical protein